MDSLRENFFASNVEPFGANDPGQLLHKKLRHIYWTKQQYYKIKAYTTTFTFCIPERQKTCPETSQGLSQSYLSKVTKLYVFLKNLKYFVPK